MSEGKRISLEEARELCHRLIEVLDYGGRVEVAGSVRRGRADVGDLELVIDADQTRIAPNLPSIDARIETLVAEGVLQKRERDGKPQAWGERFKAAVYEGVNLDLWLVRPDRNFETVWLIRTGPSDANKLLVTRQSAGGWLPEHLGFCEGDLWRLAFPASPPFARRSDLPTGSRRVMGDEETIFNALGMHYIAPGERTVEAYRSAINNFSPTWEQPESHSLTLHTARIDVTDPNVLDITIDGASKGRSGWLGTLLAPTWGMVQAHKHSGDDAAYTKAYLELLRWRYRHYRADFVWLLDRERLVLTCFCPAGTFCHRHLAIDVLKKIGSEWGIDVSAGGELEAASEDDPDQLPLFDLPQLTPGRSRRIYD